MIWLSWIIICALENHYCQDFQCYYEWETFRAYDLVRSAYLRCALGLGFSRKTKFQDIANGCFCSYPCFHTSQNHVNPSTRHDNMLLNTPPNSIFYVPTFDTHYEEIRFATTSGSLLIYIILFFKCYLSHLGMCIKWTIKVRELGKDRQNHKHPDKIMAFVEYLLEHTLLQPR